MLKVNPNAALLAFILIASIGCAQDRSAIDVGRVADILNGSGMRVAPDQIRVAGGLTARIDSVLSVDRVERLSNTELSVRIRCRTLDQCIPFLVTVSWPDASALKTSILHLKKNRGGLVRPKRSLDVRTGRELTLVIRSSAMLATMPVVAMQNGIVGDKIRVRSKDQKKIFLATLIDSRTVEIVI